MSRVVIVSARIGAGHDGAARELDRRLTARGVRVDRIDFLDLLPGPLGRLVCEVYRRQLTAVPRSWDWALALLDMPPLAAVARCFARLAVPRLVAFLKRDVALGP